MMKAFSRLLLSGLLWQRYQHKIKPFALFLLAVLLVFVLHAEYLRYAEVSGNNRFIGLSFIVKWLMVSVATLVYFFFPISDGLFGSATQRSQTTMAQEKSAKAQAKEHVALAQSQQVDPFRNIRARKQLRRKGDFILDDDSP